MSNSNSNLRNFLVTICDASVKTRLTVDIILEECEANVIDKKDPKVTFIRQGSEASQSVFRLLMHSPTVENGYKDKIDISDLEFALEV